MAIGPQGTGDAELNAESLVEQLERTIDEQLAGKTGTSLSAQFKVASPPSDAVFQGLRERYGAAGWSSVTFTKMDTTFGGLHYEILLER